MAEQQFTGYGIDKTDFHTEIETRRLAALTAWRDPRTFSMLEDIGIAPGWHCLEVGAGSGTVSRWMVDRVMPGGSVLSVDVDLRFHCDAVPGMEIREVDVMEDPLPEAVCDLVHARALLMHLHDRPRAVDRFVSTLRPGGWIVLEDGDWRGFEDQPLPEPLATVARTMAGGLRNRTGSNPDIGTSVLRMFAERGLVDLDVTGEVKTMRGGTFTMHWWSLGMRVAGPRMVEHGVVTQGQLDEALALTEDPDFVMVSPVSLGVRGRVPV